MRHRALQTLLLISTIFLLAGCTYKHNIPVTHSQPIGFDDVRQQVMLLASKTGIPEDKIKKSSTKELLVDIELKLNKNHKYDGKLLTADEMKILSNYLNDQHQILRTIKSYHHYMQLMQNKKIIVFPENDQ